jgi:hypothetical protein
MFSGGAPWVAVLEGGNTLGAHEEAHQVAVLAD